MKRTRKPHRAHCLVGALFSLLCLTFIGSLLAIERAICGMASNAASLCSVVPANWIPGLAAGAVLGLLWTAYKAYRDFHLGEYWFEHDE